MATRRYAPPAPRDAQTGHGQRGGLAGLRPGEVPPHASFSPRTRREIIRGAARPHGACRVEGRSGRSRAVLDGGLPWQAPAPIRRTRKRPDVTLLQHHFATLEKYRLNGVDIVIFDSRKLYGTWEEDLGVLKRGMTINEDGSLYAWTDQKELTGVWTAQDNRLRLTFTSYRYGKTIDYTSTLDDSIIIDYTIKNLTNKALWLKVDEEKKWQGKMTDILRWDWLDQSTVRYRRTSRVAASAPTEDITISAHWPGPFDTIEDTVEDLASMFCIKGYSVAIEEPLVLHSPAAPLELIIAIFVGSTVASALINTVVADVYGTIKDWARKRFDREHKSNFTRNIIITIYGPAHEELISLAITSETENQNQSIQQSTDLKKPEGPSDPPVARPSPEP